MLIGVARFLVASAVLAAGLAVYAISFIGFGLSGLPFEQELAVYAALLVGASMLVVFWVASLIGRWRAAVIGLLASIAVHGSLLAYDRWRIAAEEEWIRAFEESEALRRGEGG